MLIGRDGRKCVQFSCTVYGDRVCCADCELREAGCTQPAGPCQNDPERCGLEDASEHHRGAAWRPMDRQAGGRQCSSFSNRNGRFGLKRSQSEEPPENLELLALEVAARVMEAAGLCRHESRDLCRRKLITKPVCEKCLAEWCLNRAKKIESGIRNEELKGSPRSRALCGERKKEGAERSFRRLGGNGAARVSSDDGGLEGMIFRKEYKSIEEAVQHLLCPVPDETARFCFSCRFSAWNNGDQCSCWEYMRRHTEEVAGILGLEIVREDGD